MLTVTIIGNIGNDAVIKDYNGQKFISFNVAHSEKYNDQNGQKVERTTWVSCTKKGESSIASYLKKGTKVYVRGDYSDKLYQDQYGQYQISRNLRVREIQLLDSKQQDEL